MQYNYNPQITQVWWNILRIDITQELSWCWPGKVCFCDMQRRIVSSVVENVADFAALSSVLSAIYMTPGHCAALDFAKTTTDVTLEQWIQNRHPRKFL